MRRRSFTIIGAAVALAANGAARAEETRVDPSPVRETPEIAAEPPTEPRKDDPPFKLTPRLSQALLYETNPASEHAPKRGYWSWATIAGVDVAWRLTPAVALSFTLQEKIWRYPRRSLWHSNDTSASAALTVDTAGFAWGARVNGFASHDADFGALIERRVDVGLFVSRAFVEPTTGLRVTPSLSLARRFSGDRDAEKWRTGASLALVKRVGAIEFSARVSLAHESFLRCAARPCRIDRGLAGAIGASWAPRPGVEIGVGVDFERYLSTRRDQSYSAITASPRLGAKVDF